MITLHHTRYISEYRSNSVVIGTSPIHLVNIERSSHYLLCELHIPTFLIRPASLQKKEKFAREIYDLTPIQPKPPFELFTILSTTLLSKKKKFQVEVRLDILPFLLYNEVLHDGERVEEFMKYVKEKGSVIELDGSPEAS
jgi:hypothetical protein